MPSVTLNQRIVERMVGVKLPISKLKDRISMLGCDLESIENGEIKVEIFPNRPDMLCEHGLGRALSSFVGVKMGLRKYRVVRGSNKVIVEPSVSMRPYIACAIVRKLKITEEQLIEIIQLQEKLAITHGRGRKKSAYGIYPLQRVEFPLRYAAMNANDVEFQPLGFEHTIRAAEVVELHPKGRAYAHLCKGWERFPFLLDAQGMVLSMLPFTNSEQTGKVVEGTREVLLEATGTDRENVHKALNIMVAVMMDMGGEAESVEIVYLGEGKMSEGKSRKGEIRGGDGRGRVREVIRTPNLDPEKVKLDLGYVEGMLGVEMSKKRAGDLLGMMGYGYKGGYVMVPAYRADIMHQADIVEDLAIAYGYENFEPEIPNIATVGMQDRTEKFILKLREACVGLGLCEVVNYHLMSRGELEMVAGEGERIVSLKNAISEHNCLRNSVIAGLIKTLSANQHNEYPQNIFEVGRVFRYDEKAECGVAESDAWGAAVCHEKADFTEMWQRADGLASMLGVQLKIKETQHQAFMEGRVGELWLDGVKAGLIGEIHPKVLIGVGLMMPCSVVQIDIGALIKASQVD